MATLRAWESSVLTTTSSKVDFAGGDLFQADDHAQGRGLAAARGPQQGDELAVVDGEVQIVDRMHLVDGANGRSCSHPSAIPAP